MGIKFTGRIRGGLFPLDTTIENNTPFLSLKDTATNGREFRIQSVVSGSAGQLAIRDETAGADRWIVGASGALEPVAIGDPGTGSNVRIFSLSSTNLRFRGGPSQPNGFDINFGGGGTELNTSVGILILKSANSDVRADVGIFRMDPGGVITFQAENTKFGIGTAPSYKLHVLDSSANATAFIRQDGSGPLLSLNAGATERLRAANGGNLILGSGEASGTPVGNTLRAPDGSGTDITGGTLTLRGGLATGNATTGDILFQGAAAGASGTALQTAISRMAVKGNAYQITLYQATANLTLAWNDPAAARTLTLPDPGGADTFAFLSATQTFTNKTLSAPTLSGTVGGTYTLGGTPTLGATITFADAINLVLNATTGTKFGTATTQKLGFFNATPIIQPSAYTQTYAIADKTHANPLQTAVVTTAATQTSPWGYTTQAQADDIVAQLNNVRNDMLDLKQLVNSVIDDVQALGLAA